MSYSIGKSYIYIDGCTHWLDVRFWSIIHCIFFIRPSVVSFIMKLSLFPSLSLYPILLLCLCLCFTSTPTQTYTNVMLCSLHPPLPSIVRYISTSTSQAPFLCLSLGVVLSLCFVSTLTSAQTCKHS